MEPTSDVRALVEELEEELSQIYPIEQSHGLSLDAIFQRHIRFFVAKLEGVPVGCGGIALLGGFAEIKRMFVRKSSRGRAIADAILAKLEKEARTNGLNVLRLETGIRQLPALKFYERTGFTLCSIFPPYSEMESHAVATSVFMEKRLALAVGPI
jgi:putative acetyltransferase